MYHYVYMTVTFYTGNIRARRIISYNHVEYVEFVIDSITNWLGLNLKKEVLSVNNRGLSR